MGRFRYRRYHTYHGKVLPRGPNPDNDPFSMLSNEIIREIALAVPYEDLRSLRAASRPFYNDTQSNHFWKWRIAIYMPWLWDLKPFLQTWTTPIDYRKLYHWLEVVMMPKFGVEEPFLAIANRRRIWQCCLQISNYAKYLSELKYAAEPDTEMVAQAQRPNLFKVAPTQASRQDDIGRTFWLHSGGELQTSRFGAFIFETFWNDDGLLTGIGVTLRDSQRVFGTRSSNVQTTPLMPGDWITEMKLFFGHDGWAEDNPNAGIKKIDVSFVTSSH